MNLYIDPGTGSMLFTILIGVGKAEAEGLVPDRIGRRSGAFGKL